MTTTTLTDRYVEEILRRLPAPQRSDVERELRASIADAVDDRLAAGTDRAEAEAEVLTELGDPQRLAASYAERPLYLIGPALFLDYKKVLTALLVTIVPIVTTVVALIDVSEGAPVGEIIMGTLGVAVTTALHIAFWTTVGFALLECTPAQHRPPTRAWTAAHLPETPSKRAQFGELVAVTVGFVLVTTRLLLSRVISPRSDAEGRPISVLSPELWESGLLYVFIGLVVLSLVMAYVRYYTRWSLPLGIVGFLVDIAPPVMLIWLAANERLVNPAFLDAMEWTDQVHSWINRGVIILGVVSILSAVFEEIKRARRR